MKYSDLNKKKFAKKSKEKEKSIKHSSKLYAPKKVLFFGGLFIFLIGATIAFQHAITVTATNPFTLGEVTVTIKEEFDGWDTKKIYLTNDKTENSVPGVVRAMIIPVLKDTQSGNGLGGSLEALSEPVNNEMVVGDFTFYFASDWYANWFYKDGYFYYRKVLEPGETTTQLLDKVALTEDTPEKQSEYAGITVEVEVLADILQAEGGAAADAWGVIVNGNTVSP